MSTEDAFAEMRAELERLRREHVSEVMSLAREVVHSESPPSSKLVEMCTYHLETGGKRLRALVPLAVAEALDVDPSELYPFSAACELLHNATLVHDDLQDGDELRRGEPSVWDHFGPEHAINLGDAMLYWPILCLDRLEITDASYRRCVRRFVRQTVAVIDGQEREFALKRSDNPTREDYERMVEGKTAGLLVLATAGAAELGGADPRTVDGLERAATELGVLFQIQDDVLDLYGDKGRDERGADLREGKVSALAVHFLQHAPPSEADRLRDLLRRDRASVDSEAITSMAREFRRAGSLDAALSEIERRRRSAIRAEGVREDDELRSLVAGLADLFVAPISHLTSD